MLAFAPVGERELAAVPGATTPAPSAVLAFAPVGERELATVPGLSIGIVSATPGWYAQERSLLRSSRVVTADLPAGRAGYEDLLALSAHRAPGELLLVMQRSQPDGHEPGGHELLWAGDGGHELLWAAAGGLPGGGGHELSSDTTTQRGLIAAVDIAPTILRHLGLPVPAGARGYPIHLDGRLDSSYLRGLMARLHVISPRRLPALAWLLIAWTLLLLASAAWPRARAWAMRVGALGVLWAPVALLIPAALEPSAAVEYAMIALTCLTLGALTDRLLRWPRALLAPAIAALVALTVDALAGTQLLMRSLLGPDPILGARFYGIGNELKSGLAVLVFAAVAAALHPTSHSPSRGRASPRGRPSHGPSPHDPSAHDPSPHDPAPHTLSRGRASPRGRRPALAMAGAGIVLAVVEGSARIGAGVGGVILVCAGAAVATVMLLPGALTPRRALAVPIAPVAGLAALAALDLTTAHGTGHFTGSVLHARSLGAIGHLLAGRYEAAWDELHKQAMPAATAVALLCAGLGIHRRERLLAPVAHDPVWPAALCGGLTAGVVGALVEDSGPVLLVVAVFALACVLTYLWAGSLADRAPIGQTQTAGRSIETGEISVECPGLGSPSGKEVWDTSQRPPSASQGVQADSPSASRPSDSQPLPRASRSPVVSQPTTGSSLVTSRSSAA